MHAQQHTKYNLTLRHVRRSARTRIGRSVVNCTKGTNVVRPVPHLHGFNTGRDLHAAKA
jgi:hypothetical protein